MENIRRWDSSRASPTFQGREQGKDMVTVFCVCSANQCQGIHIDLKTGCQK